MKLLKMVRFCRRFTQLAAGRCPPFNIPGRAPNFIVARVLVPWFHLCQLLLQLRLHVIMSNNLFEISQSRDVT